MRRHDVDLKPDQILVMLALTFEAHDHGLVGDVFGTERCGFMTLDGGASNLDERGIRAAVVQAKCLEDFV